MEYIGVVSAIKGLATISSCPENAMLKGFFLLRVKCAASELRSF